MEFIKEHAGKIVVGLALTVVTLGVYAVIKIIRNS